MSKLTNKEVTSLLKKHPKYLLLQVYMCVVIVIFLGGGYLFGKDYDVFEYIRWGLMIAVFGYAFYLRKDAVKRFNAGTLTL